MPRNILRVKDVTMQFGGVIAVDNLSLEVNENEIVSLIGPNGAGKTTAFNVITGVYPPTNGAVYFKDNMITSNFPKGSMKKLYTGQNFGKYTAAMKKTPDKITKLGMARTFQNIRLFKELSAFDNVLIAKHMHAKANFISAALGFNYKEERAMREETMQLLDILGLHDVKNEIAHSLPYGQQRHLEIARALATKPELLLLDEPAAGMNPQETDELTAFIYDIRKKFNLTIFIIEHHMNLVMDISDRIYVLDFGKLIAAGTPEEVQKNQRVIDAYLGVPEDGEK
jgi:branched-chain amino acid transport system ATP-binding protein